MLFFETLRSEPVEKIVHRFVTYKIINIFLELRPSTENLFIYLGYQGFNTCENLHFNVRKVQKEKVIGHE